MFFMIAVVAFIIKHFVSKDETEGYRGKEEETEKKSVGFWEGLKTLITCPYVGGIFGLVFFHEVVTALMHFQLLRSVEAFFYPNQGLVSKFLFKFTLMMQSISCLFALFGTSYFQRKFGVRGCLILFPLLLGVGLGFYFVCPTLTFIAGVIVIAKGINYVLNQPVKEMLYIPTTRAVKYKAKAWIDMFGLRSAKMGGSVINNMVGLMAKFTTGLSLVLVVLWIVLAKSVGSHYRKVIEKGDRIGN